jgi:integrase
MAPFESFPVCAVLFHQENLINGSHVFQVRFTRQGRRRSFTTGERDSESASGEAARIYAGIISGRWSPGKRLIAPAGMAFAEMAALWLADIESSVDARTLALYADTYVATHFVLFFNTIDRLTTVGAEDYISSRLRQVTRETVKKELPVLRRLAKWAHRRGYLGQMPEIETPGLRVLGHVQASSRKCTFLVFTKQEMETVIAKLPEYATSKRSRERFPVRARFRVAWESSLRPATLDKLSAPENYRVGSSALTISDETDKSRFGRELPLSLDARKALDSVCPVTGIIFGSHDFRTLLRPAARAAGIDAYRADRISDYDFRHSRLTHLGQVTSNLSGVMYLAGHKQPATTARYMRPQKAAAEDVLQAAAAAGQPEFWLHSGCGATAAKRHPAALAGKQKLRTYRKDSGFLSVRGGGLEPPWLLTASTSS